MKTRSYSKLSASLLLALALGPAVNAAPISGTIAFASAVGSGLTLQDGSAVTTTDLTAAKGVKTWGTTAINGTSGAFTVIPTATVPTLAAPWVFNPSTPLVGLWSVTGGGETFTFNLLTSTIATQTSAFLSVTGTGMVTGTGTTNYTQTPGTWNFSTQAGATGGQFSWSAASAVPDGGTTMALLGLSLLGLYGARRKFTTL